MTQTLESLKAEIHRARVTRDLLKEAVDARAQRLKEAVERIEAHEAVQALIQDTATETQESMRLHLTSTVQHCLDAIFPGTYTFKTEFEISRGKTSVSLSLEKDGYALEDLLNECGGTVVDIVAMALRVAVWTLNPTDNCIIGDEVGKHVSDEYKNIFWELIKGLSDTLGIQFICVTHDRVNGIEWADRVFLMDTYRDGKWWKSRHTLLK